MGEVTGPVLKAGVAYTITVVGTASDWNNDLGSAAEPDAMFPTTGGYPRKSTEVAIDADTIWAEKPPGHWTQFQIDTGSGFRHVEPIGGPFTTPQPGHAYTYEVVGTGSAVAFRWNDSALADNYGSFHIGVSAVGQA